MKMEDFLDRGITQAAYKNYYVAIDFFNQAIAIDSEFVEAYYRRGLTYLDSGDAQQAIIDFDRCLNLDQQQIEVYLSRAEAFGALNQLQAGIIDLQIALSLDPNCDQAYKLQANVCLRLGEYDQAIEYLKQVGDIYLQRQDQKSCKYCSDKIRQIENQKISTRRGMTTELFLQQIQYKISKGLFAEAYVDCNWLLELDPYNAWAYQFRGNVCQEVDEYDQVQQNFRQAAKYFRTRGNLGEAERVERHCMTMQLNKVYHQNYQSKRRFRPKPAPENDRQQRLYDLVGNWDVAQGLVSKLMKRHPDRNESWCWSRTVIDIEYN